MFPALCVEHSKICRDFSKKLAICIFGCPKLYFGWKNWWNFFLIFIGGTLMFFLKLALKSQGDFWKNLQRKIIRVPPMKNVKIWKIFSSIFFIQGIAWDIQKCILEVFLKNLYILWNAPHIRLGTFWGHKPFYICKYVCPDLIGKIGNCINCTADAWVLSRERERGKNMLSLKSNSSLNSTKNSFERSLSFSSQQFTPPK